MHIKRYTVAAFILILSVGLYINVYVTNQSIGLDFFGIQLPSLAVAIWVVVPLIMLFIASVLHMSFYSILGSFKLRKYEKDYEKVIDAIVDAYLGKEDRKHDFKTPRYKLLGSLIDNTTLFPNSDIELNGDNEKINRVINIINDIKSGKIVDLKKFSLPSENSLVYQNDRNKYKQNEINAEEILTHPKKYADVLQKEAYLDFVKVSPFYAIEKYKHLLSFEGLLVILARINAKENRLEVSNEALIELFKLLDLSSKDYLKASEVLSFDMIPEQRIKLFELMSDEDEKVMDAYLYTLFDLEMLEAADVILEISQPEEYINFKAYRALKECNKHYSIKLFI